MKTMKKNILSWALPAILLTGCAQESMIDETENVGQDLIFETINGTNSGTRTTIDGGGLITWSATDKIRVNGAESNTPTIADEGATAKFAVSGVSGSTFAALYPSSMYAGYSDGTYAVNLPSTQKYNSNVSFSDDANPSVAYSTSTNSDLPNQYKLAFYNLCGMMKVNIKAASGPLTGIRYVRLTTNENITGAFKADCKTYKISEDTGTRCNTIDMDLGSDKSTNEDISVLFVLPPKTYSAGWSLTLLDDTKEAISKPLTATSEITIRRSKISSMTANFKPDYVLTVLTSAFGTWDSNAAYFSLDEFYIMLAHGTYYDDDTKWRFENEKTTYTGGIWIKIKDLDNSLPPASTSKPIPVTEEIKTDKNWVFVPLAGEIYSNGNLMGIGDRTLIWTKDYLGEISPLIYKQAGAILMYKNEIKGFHDHMEGPLKRQHFCFPVSAMYNSPLP